MDQYLGKIIRFQAQPYHSGTAEITAIETETSGMWTGYNVLTVRTVDATERSRLFQHTSDREFNDRVLKLYHYREWEIRKAVEEGDTLIYVYPV